MDPSAINHIALNCRDLAAQEAFFSKHFGFQRSRTFKAGKPDEYIMLKLVRFGWNSSLPIRLRP